MTLQLVFQEKENLWWCGQLKDGKLVFVYVAPTPCEALRMCLEFLGDPHG